MNSLNEPFGLSKDRISGSFIRQSKHSIVFCLLFFVDANENNWSANKATGLGLGSPTVVLFQSIHLIVFVKTIEHLGRRTKLPLLDNINRP